MKEKIIKKYCLGCNCFWCVRDKDGAVGCAYGDGDPTADAFEPLSSLSVCPKGEDHQKKLRRYRKRESKEFKRIFKSRHRRERLLRDLRVGLIAGLVAGIVYLIEFVTLK